MFVRIALSVLFLFLAGLQSTGASERLLKMRQYTFNCGGGQECAGWRHTFAYLDPAARDAELPRDTYVELYTTREVDELIDLRHNEIRSELPAIVESAMAKRPEAALSAEERIRLRDDIAAEVVAQFAKLMAQQEAQTRAWLQDLVREEMKAVGAVR